MPCFDELMEDLEKCQIHHALFCHFNQENIMKLVWVDYLYGLY